VFLLWCNSWEKGKIFIMVQGVPQKIDRTESPDTSDIVSSMILIKKTNSFIPSKGIPLME